MVTAIGGIFIYSENPKRLAEWYEKSLKLSYGYTEKSKAYYITFPYRELKSEQERYSIFSILYNKDRPFIADKSFTVNLRVLNIEEIIDTLKSLQIPVSELNSHDEGKFAWLNDPEGNYIELWEDKK